ncbi:MAG: adenylate cyclase, partial [Gammaproteobacteria bacterium]
AELAPISRQRVFDSYHRLVPRLVERFPAIIVDIDDRSLAALGQWPWPRTLTARLVAAVAELEPLAIGFDIIMPEPDRLSPAQLALLHPDIDAAVKQTLNELESNDSILGNTIARFPVVLARAGLHDAEEKPKAVTRTPIMHEGGGDLSKLLSFDDLLLNVPELERGAGGFGLVNTTRDADGVVRRVPLLMSYGGEAMPSLAVELLRVGIGANWLTVKTDAFGIRAVGLGDSLVETDADGQITAYFSAPDPRRRVSAVDVLNRAPGVAALKGQVALIGVTGLGLTDVVATPVSSSMDGVEVHAQMIENIISGQRLLRPKHALHVELATALIFGAMIIWLLPRLTTTSGFVVVLATVLSGFGLSFGAFLRWRELYDPVPLTATSVAISILLLGVMLSASNRHRRALDAALQSEKLQAARMAGELGAAREIQLGMLPDPQRIAGLPQSIRVAAFLEPAREVGGDLYDFYMLDARRLFFMLGDVAGKGVPASLFMAISKVLCKQVASRDMRGAGGITSELNKVLSTENPAELFVTAVAVLLDVETGEGQLCIAGHDAPLVVSPGGPVRSVDSSGGPPLCTLDDFDYPSEPFTLAPGEMMVLWTDGVGESSREQAAQVGTDKIDEIYYAREGVVRFLQQLELEATPDDVVSGLYSDVTAFSSNAENSDDIAIIAIQYRGAGH